MWVLYRGVRGQGSGVRSHLEEIQPLSLSCADGLLDAAQLVEDGLGLVQLVVSLTAGHLPVDPARTHTHTNTHTVKTK